MVRHLLIGIVLVCIGVSAFFFLRTDFPSSSLVSSSSHNRLWHIAVIVMENKANNNIIGNPNAPYINSLLPKAGYASKYSAVAHPSLPNYIALLSGGTQGITTDCTSCFLSSHNLVDQLESAKISWKAYMESIPSACFIGNAGYYVQKHDPFMYFNDIRTQIARCHQIVPYTQLSNDISSVQTTPAFIWITPNICDDMHSCSIQTGDIWLSKQVPMILNSPAFIKQHSLLIITWDENDGSIPNTVPTLFIGNIVRKGFVSQTAFNHYSLLHTIEAVWHLPSLTHAVEKSSIMTSFFTPGSY